MPIHIHSVSVFCGSRMGNNPAFEQDAYAIGAYLAQYGFKTLFGGCDSGLMQKMATGVTNFEGIIENVYPEAFAKSGRYAKAAFTHVSKDVHTQRRYMRHHSDIAIVLPGGINSFSEMFDQASDNDFKAISNRKSFCKPIIVCNSGGFYDGLIMQLEKSVEMGFTTPDQMKMFHFANSAKEAVLKLLELDRTPQMLTAELRPAAKPAAFKPL